jgi:hypothetical protein
VTAEDAKTLWASNDPTVWQEALDRYPAVVEAQEIAGLADLDRWYRDELPAAVASRSPAYIDRAELTDISKWKMMRGEWRQRNLMLVRSNRDLEIRAASEEAFALVPDPKAPLARIAKLAGVGAATASAALAPYRGDLYPFLDELVGGAIPGLEDTKFTVTHYVKYADALRQKAAALGAVWTAQRVGLALWSASGGKVALD